MDAVKWKLPKCHVTKRINFSILMIIVGTIIYVIFNYQVLPEEIPIHFNFIGEADGWGGKATILVIPFTMVPSLLLGYAFSKMPHYMHEGELDEEDKRKYIAIGKNLAILNLLVAILMLYIVWMITQTAHDRTALEPWSFLIIMGAFLIMTVRLIIVSRSKGKNVQ